MVAKMFGRTTTGKVRTVYPSRYSKMFSDFWWSKTAFWDSLCARLRAEKDVFVLVTGNTGCQIAGDKVLLSNGDWKNIEDIKIGDEVISPQKDGTCKYSKVLSTTKWFSENVYDIVQNNRSHNKLYSCSDNHVIPFYNKSIIRGTDNNGKRYQKGTKWSFREYDVKTINNMSQNGFSHRNIGFSTFAIDKFKDKINCTIKPYSLGVWLGDGIFTRKLSITSNDTNVMNCVGKDYNIMNIYNKKGTTCKDYIFSINSNFAIELEKYKLRYKKSDNKFIPKEALLSDLDYRLKLLAGLIDSDSYYRNGGYNYVSKSKQLIEDIKSLVFSVGGRAYDIKKIKKGIKSTGFTGDYYSISFFLGDIKLPIVTERRKRKTKCVYLDPNRLSIYTKKTKPQMVYGFELDSESKWYITNDYMVTHNSGKSSFVADLCFRHAEKEDNFVLNDGTKMFSDDNFIIDPEEFAYKMITKEGQVLWLDEARRVANRRKWYSQINNAVADRKNQNRKLFNMYFLCMPFEKEFDPVLASHLSMWLWVRRGVVEVYVARNDIKGGQGLNIPAILEREQKWLKENPKHNFVIPFIHPEYVGRIAFNKLTPGYNRRYQELVNKKKATGDLSDEEKKKYGIVAEVKPENVIMEAVEQVKEGKIKNKKELWLKVKDLDLSESSRMKLLNFYLKLEGLDTFGKLFEKSKLQVKDIW